ncbi:MAG: alpha/beta fold hydrolase, partial [Giesbergeria sp.]
GAGDRFIAPAAGCEALLQAFGGSDNSFVLCGRAQGFAEDYTHDRILLSRPASRELWPRIGTWLAAQT